jgi:hypothetical protein
MGRIPGWAMLPLSMDRMFGGFQRPTTTRGGRMPPLRTALEFAVLPVAAILQKQQPECEESRHAGQHDKPTADVVIEKESPDSMVQAPGSQRNDNPNDPPATWIVSDLLLHTTAFDKQGTLDLAI